MACTSHRKRAERKSVPCPTNLWGNERQALRKVSRPTLSRSHISDAVSISIISSLHSRRILHFTKFSTSPAATAHDTPKTHPQSKSIRRVMAPCLYAAQNMRPDPPRATPMADAPIGSMGVMVFHLRLCSGNLVVLFNSHSASMRHPDMPAWCQWALAATGNHISHHIADADHIRHGK